MRTKIILIGNCLLLTVLLTIGTYAQSFTKIDTSIVCNEAISSPFASWADINNDGFEDLIVVNGNIEAAGSFNHNMYLNNGDWKFSQIADNPIVNYTSPQGSNTAVWADYDNDGFVDLFIDYYPHLPNQLYKNNGDGTFTQITTGNIANDIGDSGPSSWVDIDNDGYVDLYVTNKRMQKNCFYRNNGDGTFTKLTEGILANLLYHMDYGPSWSDFDNDGDIDGFGTSFYIPKRYVLMNEGSGNFSFNVTTGLTIAEEATWGWFPPSWGDYNNDGWQDVFIATWGKGWISDYDLLYRNNGNGTFSRITEISPVESRNTHEGAWWGDLDNNGYLDLIVSTFYGTYANKVYMNNGDGSFTANADINFAKDRGGFVNIIDINNDGFLDLFVARGFDGTLNNLLYANDGNANSWLTIKPIGTTSNKSAIGTKIEVKANIGGTDMWQIRETGLTANGMKAHFGLGDATIIDSIIIKWPSGIDTVLKDIIVNQHLVITESVPSDYLKASFTFDTTFGIGELEVNFKDLSKFDPGMPVTSWSWDFNGDSIEDSHEQNPVYTYSNPEGGVYTVSLKVSNGADSSIMVKKDLIRIKKTKPAIEDNLSLWSAATTASNIYSGFWYSECAFDNDTNSTWKTGLSYNNEWLKVELDTIYKIGKVIIDWEAGFASGYEIQTSLDDENWDTVYCNCVGDGGFDTLYFTGIDARYVKMQGVKKGNSYGYGITEFEIFQSDGNTYESHCDECKTTTGINENGLTQTNPVKIYPNPMTNQVKFTFDLISESKVLIEFYDVTGRKVKEIYNGTITVSEPTITWNRKELLDGIYFYKITIMEMGKMYSITGKLVVKE